MPLNAVLVGIHTSEQHLARAFARADEPWVPLARDVANRFRVLLDGPKEVLDID